MKNPISITICLILIGFILSACGTGGSGTTQATSVALTAPTGIAVSTAGANQVSVAWQPVSGATSYNLYWSTASGVTIATGTKITNVSSPYTHTGLSSSSTYYYIVTAVYSAGESAPSNQASVTSVAIPAAPAGVTATGGANQVTVSWAAVSGATSYNIYWSTLSGVTKTTGTKIASVATPYAHTGLSANSTYYYIVTAVNSAGESAASNQASATTAAVAGSAPGAPIGVTAVSGTNQVTVAWNAVSGATSYNIYWSNDPTHVMKDMSPKITGVTSPYHNTGLAAGTTYAYVVTAVNASGESTESAIVSAKTSATDGVALYAANCASCHGSLATSGKQGRTVSQIQAAITGNRGGMASLSTLTAAQVKAIADVLAW